MPDLTFGVGRGVAEVIAAQEKIAAEMGKQKTAAQQLNQEYRANQTELGKLNRIAQQLYRDNETAQERYNRKLAEAKAALQGNVNETELLKRVTTQLALEFSRSADSNKHLAQQRAQAAKDAIKEQEALKKKVQETNDSASGIDDALSKAFSPGKMLGYAAGFVSVQKAVGLVTGELQAQQKMIDSRAAAQMTVGESRNVLLRNLDINNPAEIRKIQESATRIASQTGVSETAINNALAQTYSSTSGDVPLSISSVDLAARYLGDQPSNIPQFAGTLADLSRVTGSKDPRVQLGLIRAVGAVSRVVDADKQARSIPQALIGAGQFGGTARTSGALFGALSGGGADQEGQQTATAQIALSAQLDEMAKGKGAFEPSKLADLPTQQQWDIGQLMVIPGLDERIKYLQQHKGVAEAFLDRASFEKKMLGPIQQLLLDPKSKVAQDYQANLGKIPGNQELAGIADKTLGVFGSYNALEPTAQRSRALKQTLERFQTRHSSEYLSTEEQGTVKDLLMESGQSGLSADLGDLVGKLKGGGKIKTSEVVGRVSARVDELEHPTIHYSGVGDGDPGQTFDRPPTPAESEAASILREMLSTLRSIEQHAQGQLKSQERTETAIKDSGIVAGAE